MTHTSKLEDSELWRKVTQIAVDAYAVVGDLPKEEEWDMKARLHRHAFLATNDVAEACGAIDPRDTKWLLGKARADLFGIKNAYYLGYKTGELPEKSEMMVLINQCIQLIDKEIQGLDAAIQGWFETLRDKTGEQKRGKSA